MADQNATAYQALAAADPVLRQLIEQNGQPDPFDWAARDFPSATNFEAMALHIVGQQISVAAALTIYGRVAVAAGGIVTPKHLLALSEDDLRSCGLSRAKSGYLHDLARRQDEGIIDLEHMSDVTDDSALASLTAVRGVGLWSAQMFLLHQLKRADILPAADIGVRRAIQRAWRLEDAPTPDETRQRALPWSPYRSYAAALLWSSLAAPQVAAVDDSTLISTVDD
jgi:DNA-3-methyladenine glycosylase II